MDVVIAQLVAGISVGSVLLLAALGLSLTFGQMGVINNAHGEFMMVGAYSGFLVQMVVAEAGLSLFVSLLVGFLLGGLLGLVLEITLVSRMRSRPLDTLLATFGVALVLQQLARDLFGSQPVFVAAPGWLSGPVSLFGINVPAARVFIFGLSIACLVALHLVLQLTPLGRQIRATMQNRDLAEASGISTRTVDRVTFFLGSGIAGIAGAGLTLLNSISFNFGANFIVGAFLVIVAGGVGQLKGTVIAAFALGIFSAVTEYFTSASMATVFMLLAVVVLLQFRPQGIVSVRTRSLA